MAQQPKAEHSWPYCSLRSEARAPGMDPPRSLPSEARATYEYRSAVCSSHLPVRGLASQPKGKRQEGSSPNTSCVESTLCSHHGEGTRLGLWGSRVVRRTVICARTTHQRWSAAYVAALPRRQVPAGRDVMASQLRASAKR